MDLAPSTRPTDGQAGATSPLLRLNLERLLVTVPAVAALGLGGLYGLGAILWTASLMSANLSPPTVLPLIPLEQVLGRGIGAAVIALIVSPLFLLLLPLAAYADRRHVARQERRREAGRDAKAAVRGAKDAIEDHDFDAVAEHLHKATEAVDELRPRETSFKRVAALSAASTVLLIGTLAISPPVFAGGLLLQLVGYMTWLVHAMRNDRHPRVLRVMLTSIAAVGVLIVVQTFVAPRPLPRVELVPVQAGERISGGLVAATGSTWYLSPANRRMVAVPTRQVRHATVSLQTQPPRTLGEIVIGRRFISNGD